MLLGRLKQYEIQEFSKKEKIICRQAWIIMENTILIGRDKEVTIIRDYMRQRKHLIIFGEKGVGKTAIIKQIISERSTNNILYSQNSRTLKEALVNLVFSGRTFCDYAQNIAQKNILALRKLFYKILDKNPQYIVFDHLAKAGPKYYSFLEYIVAQRQIPLLIVSRSLRKEDIGHLGMILYDFAKIEISDLDGGAAASLTEYFIVHLGIDVAGKAEFKKDIFHYSGGNPKIIKELCVLAADAKYQRKGFLDTNLLDIDRRINELSLPNV